MRVFFIGTAVLIGYHLAGLLLAEGQIVHGYDGMTDYYGVSLKQRRHTMLRQHVTFTATEALLGTKAPSGRPLMPAHPM